jgi:hypothetical protein
VDESSTTIRFFVALTGVIAESCVGTGDGTEIDAYGFTSPSAEALGVTTVTKTRISDDNIFWDFGDVGLDELYGSLVLTTTIEHNDFTLAYDGGDTAMTGTLTVLRCDVAGDAATVAGSGTETVASDTAATDDKREISAFGPAPYPGLEWSPVSDFAPVSGQVHWTREAESHAVLLQDAAAIDRDARTWPGTASEPDANGDPVWSHEIDVELP